MVSRIHRLSMDDGPGLRDVVFLKGCSLRCSWCHNPEAIDRGPSLFYFKEQCIGCGACVAACPIGAISNDRRGHIDRGRCQRCGACAEVCPARAIESVGNTYAPDELVEILRKDELYFENSGGGVTFSGGEPTSHMWYLGLVSESLSRAGISVLLETNGDFDFDEFRRQVLPHVEYIYFDIKLADPERHRAKTGKGNERILANLRRLVEIQGIALVPRTPLIRGITDDRRNLDQISVLLQELGIVGWQQLPFNPAYQSKWEALG